MVARHALVTLAPHCHHVIVFMSAADIFFFQDKVSHSEVHYLRQQVETVSKLSLHIHSHRVIRDLSHLKCQASRWTQLVKSGSLHGEAFCLCGEGHRIDRQ